MASQAYCTFASPGSEPGLQRIEWGTMAASLDLWSNEVDSDDGSGFNRSDETSSCHRSLALSVEKEARFCKILSLNLLRLETANYIRSERSLVDLLN